MSDDLISRKALIEEIQSFRCSITGLRAGKGVLAHAADEYRKSVSRIIDEQPTAFDKEKVIDELREELNLSDAEKERCARENPLQFDSAKGYANGIANAIEIVEKGGIEFLH